MSWASRAGSDLVTKIQPKGSVHGKSLVSIETNWQKLAYLSADCVNMLHGEEGRKAGRKAGRRGGRSRGRRAGRGAVTFGVGAAAAVYVSQATNTV